MNVKEQENHQKCRMFLRFKNSIFSYLTKNGQMSLLYSLNDFADFQRFLYDQVPFKIDFFEEPDIIIVE